MKKHNSSSKSKKRYKEKLNLHTEKITDYYIRRIFFRHNKEMKGIELPKDFIEIYRLKIQLKREIKNGK